MTGEDSDLTAIPALPEAADELARLAALPLEERVAGLLAVLSRLEAALEGTDAAPTGS